MSSNSLFNRRIRAGLLGLALGFTLPLAAQEGERASQEQLEAELDALLQMRKQMAEQMEEFDRRIDSLAEQLRGDATAAPEAPPAAPQPQPAPESKPKPTVASSTEIPIAEDTDDFWGAYEPGKGFVLARGPQGELAWSVFSYARYLNQQALDETYTDSFGRASELDLRNDVQFQKVTMNFKGWLFDPRFRYLWYVWTSNTSQGDPAQVVVAGNLSYKFSDRLTLAGGIGGLPTTRSTNYTFPNWLKNDHRTIADEFFRGSYTTGLWINGTLAPGLKYRAMIGNNLSQLGVNAGQLDDKLNTVSAALWWMPTTGEYGPGEGLGDYEHHDEFATLFGIHATSSTEDAQAQPGTEGFENSQIRLSDGTRVFSPDPFLTGADVRKVDYQMLAVNGGFKYRGWSLEGEAYYRKLDNFRTTGPIPISSLSDHGFQVQGSAMVLPQQLQAYAAYSKIYGDHGNPSDLSLGINWFPMNRKEFRINVQGLYLDDSPVGYSSVPFAVGGDGWVFSTDAVVAF